MGQSRYIQTIAIQTDANELVPLWDPRVQFVKDDYFGDHFTISDNYGRHHNTIECMFDVKEKKLVLGVEVDLYPDIDKLEFKKGMEVMHETRTHRMLKKSTVVDIVFEEYELTIRKGKKLDSYYVERLANQAITIEKDGLYAIKVWKPTYVLEDGFKTTYEHQMHTIAPQ